MAQNVSNRYREIIYSGEKLYNCNLTINSVPIDITNIEQIKIERPIIDIQNQAFYIGTFISDKLEIIFRNALSLPIESGDSVSLTISLSVDGEDEEVNIGTFYVDELGENYLKRNTITCFDNSTRFEPAVNTSIENVFTYNSSTETYTITLENLLIWLCNHYNVTLGTYPNVNKDKIVSAWDKTISGKQYISWIAELMGGNAKINRDGELCIYSLKREPVYSVNGLKFKTFELGEKYALNTIKMDDGMLRQYTATNGNIGNTLYIRNNNMFVSSQTDIQNIFDAIGGLEVYSIIFSTFADLSLDAYDIITIEIGETSYDTFYSSNITYATSIMVEVNTQIPTKQQEVTANVIKPDDSLFRQRVYTEFDQENLRINLVSEKVDGQDSKIAKITLDYETIMAELSNISDITVSGESEIAYVDLNDVNESEPIEIKVRPIGVSISRPYPSYGRYPTNSSYPAKQGLVPSNTLTPSNSLVPAAGYPAQGILYPSNVIIRFYNTKTDELIYDYQIPYDLLYYDNENYDEFNLNYDSETCQVIKKCKYNADGTIGLLTTPETYDIEYPTISLTEGDYRISILGYNIGYIYARLMAKNIYTTQFYTKVETNRRISASAEGIMLEVADTYTNKDETNTLSTKISQKASSISLTANDNGSSCGLVIRLRDENNNVIDSQSANITLSGKVAFTNLTDGTTTISGSNIKTGTINANLVSVTNINANNITSGKINTSLLNSDVITTGNLSAQTISANQISGGTINGNNVNVTNLSASSISGGVLDLRTGNSGRVRFGSGTNHLVTTGINLGYGGVNAGINMNGGGISGIELIQNLSSGSTGSIRIMPNTENGYLYLMASSGNRIYLYSPTYGTQWVQMPDGEYYNFIRLGDILNALHNHGII